MRNLRIKILSGLLFTIFIMLVFISIENLKSVEIAPTKNAYFRNKSFNQIIEIKNSNIRKTEAQKFINNLDKNANLKQNRIASVQAWLIISLCLVFICFTLSIIDVFRKLDVG